MSSEKKQTYQIVKLQRKVAVTGSESLLRNKNNNGIKMLKSHT